MPGKSVSESQEKPTLYSQIASNALARRAAPLTPGYGLLSDPIAASDLSTLSQLQHCRQEILSMATQSEIVFAAS